MSFNRLNYDTETYKKELNQSVGPGIYHLNQPTVSCTPCYPSDPTTKLQRSGGSVNNELLMVDLDSELMGLFRKNTRNPDKHYKPCKDETVNEDDMTSTKNLLHWRDCMEPPEDTRLSNPPCTLKEIGWNRFEWLSHDPQKNIEKPFAHNISNRIIVKDNHRPVIPVPISCQPLLPKKKGLCSEKIKGVYANCTDPPSTRWRSCDEIKKY